MNSLHLVEMAARSVGRSETLIEHLLSWQIETRPFLSGTRGLARWTNLSDKTVRATVGPEGGLSEFKFLWTRTRGSSSALAEERDSMEVRFRSNSGGDYRSTSPKDLQAPGGPLAGGLGDLDKKQGKEGAWWGNAVVTAAISERAQEVLANGLKTLSELDTMKGMEQKARTLRALDASLDVWSEVQGPDAPEFALGRQAWKLAVLCGLRDVTLSTDDIAGLLGLAPKSVRDLLARMTKAIPGLVRKVRQGRSFVYEIAWAQVFDEAMGDMYDERVSRHDIRNRRAAQDKALQATAARRGTGAGYLAYRLSMANPKRAEYLERNPLPEGADGAWRALVEAGDELALYEHLRAQEAEAGPVPSTPAVLVEEAKEVTSLNPLLGQPAQESLEAPQRIDPEVLAAMRARICASTYA
ncbi:hypothetical protein AQJ43_23615 [Streptomyces avermitilis]|uniref:hypothetical protein n=1 Tax=Streptomyces TaxID=1883 RepID=UPI000567D937|nr:MULTISPECIES: hypothetical protein [Streptomyces]KUN52217.1 hypothetical protein AQJ43_23615 [Streptomyces avermitilis]MYT01121.1 hypothetical protein [Streptomyces sp. SID5469]OOV30735.1 hypothetical protein SM007_16155 [Streptomyces avermitilis]